MARWMIAVLGVMAVTVLAGCAGAPMETHDSIRRRTLAESADCPPVETPPATWAQWDREAPRRIQSAIGGYFASRGLDFLDIFEVGVSGGRWAKIQAQYLIGFWGFGATDCQRWRLGRRAFVVNEQSSTAATLPFPASLVLFPALMMDDKVLGRIIMLGGVNYEAEQSIWPHPTFHGLPHERTTIWITGIERDVDEHRFKVTGDSFPVGLEAHLFIGARARVYPLQALDFLAGIVAWDPAGDDVR